MCVCVERELIDLLDARYANLSPEMVDKQVDTLFRVVHQGTFKTSVQALLLLLQCLSIGECG